MSYNSTDYIALKPAAAYIQICGNYKLKSE